MGKIARVPITNVYADGDYTGRINVGPTKQPMNVLLDTGSSTLAFDDKKYQPNVAGGDKTTDLDLSILLTPYPDGKPKPKITGQFPDLPPTK